MPTSPSFQGDGTGLLAVFLFSPLGHRLSFQRDTKVGKFHGSPDNLIKWITSKLLVFDSKKATHGDCAIVLQCSLSVGRERLTCHNKHCVAWCCMLSLLAHRSRCLIPQSPRAHFAQTFFSTLPSFLPFLGDSLFYTFPTGTCG